MTSYYLAKDDKGLFYIRRRILGMCAGFLDNSDINPYWWSEKCAHNAHFKTEDKAIAHWERVRVYQLRRRFTTLRKLS